MKPYLWTGMALAAVAGPVGAKESQTPIAETSGMVGEGKVAEDGSAWFGLVFEKARFVLGPSKVEDTEKFWAIVIAANKNYKEVRVRYKAAAGRVDEAGGRIEFPVCSIALDDQRFDHPAGCDAPIQATRKADQELLAGWADLHANGLRPGLERVNAALSQPGLSDGYRRIALEVRGLALESVGYEEKPGSDESDRAHFAALADYRELVRLEPDKADPLFFVGGQLETLGDYDAAAQIYREIVKKWPDEDYRTSVRLAAIERIRGNYEGALELLNGLAARYGPDRGMKFYYHRGWTLTKLGRYDEAIADFTSGMKTQPDYAYALVRRACAQSQVGRIELALSDLDLAAKLMDAMLMGDRKDIQQDVHRVAELRGLLKAAVARGTNSPMPEVCDGFAGEFDRERPKSKLLSAS